MRPSSRYRPVSSQASRTALSAGVSSGSESPLDDRVGILPAIRRGVTLEGREDLDVFVQRRDRDPVDPKPCEHLDKSIEAPHVVAERKRVDLDERVAYSSARARGGESFDPCDEAFEVPAGVDALVFVRCGPRQADGHPMNP